MSKFRLEITKGEVVRYLSHLDYARAIERAIRRAKLPVAYSEGFNPHMKMSFASALSVGVTSDAEYMDIEMKESMPHTDFAKALSLQLPEGIILRKIKEVTGKTTALMAIVNLAGYTINVPLVDDENACVLAAESIARFNQAEQVLYIKESPKGKREVDLKRYATVVRSNQSADILSMDMMIKITPTGSVKPSEVLGALIDQFGLPADRKAAVINRTGLYVSDGELDLSPIDMSIG